MRIESCQRYAPGLFWTVLLALMLPTALTAQDTTAVRAGPDGVTVNFVDADLRAVIQALSGYMPKPMLVTGIPGNRVSLQTPQAVRASGLSVLLKALVESQGLEFSDDTSYIRISPRQADRPVVPAGQGDAAVRLFVIRLKHARATDVAATVNALFGGGGEFSDHPGQATGTLSDELRRAATPAIGASTEPAAGSSRPATLGGPITVTPDERTNSLLLRSSPADYEVIRNAVAELDIRPLQVLVEVLIIEARRSKDFSIGTTLFVPPQGIKGDRNGTIGGQTRGAGVGDVVLRLLNLGRADIDATLSASESRGNVKIISRPVLIASNNTEASFLVGSQRPFVQVSRLLPTDNNNQDRIIQYRDVGTRLRVRPTINLDGYVSLEIQQEINAATNEVAFDAPVISTREATTQVLVRDGQTIMLGGLQDHQLDRSRSGVPLLSGLPLIGPIFGASARTESQTELYLFITPRIIRSDEDADRLTEPHLPKEGTR